MDQGDSNNFFKECTCLSGGNVSSVKNDRMDFRSPLLGQFNFQRPPEALVFTPTAEEFKDPLLYISRIRPVAEQYGICKIQPPRDWSPPFTLDVDDFKFTPRIQHLNRLEGTTRIKLIFLERLKKFWHLKGSPMRTPMVERHALDLYVLQRSVQSEGGFEKVTKEKKWGKISTQMGFMEGRNVGSALKSHYEKILHPYNLFLEQARKNSSNGAKKEAKSKSSAREEDAKKPIEDPQPHCSNWQPPTTILKPKIEKTAESDGFETKLPNSETSEVEAQRPEIELVSPKIEPEPGSVKPENQSTDVQVENIEHEVQGPKQDVLNIEPKVHSPENKVPSPESKELRRLQFHAAGPKMVVCNNPDNISDDDSSSCKRKREERRLSERRDMAEGIALDDGICQKCNKNDRENLLLLCDKCGSIYHMTCATPPELEIPKGKWCCSKCIAKEILQNPAEPFGFEQAQKEYTLQEFGDRADMFKNSYFRMPVLSVPLHVAEEEFWRIVSSIDEEITVEYGADIHAIDHGSGFPTTETLSRFGENEINWIKEYVDHPWNLNNLPVGAGSVFKHIDSDISGMKVPWMYVGMCFSTFCWHNEDHWSYSINYLHWGEPKTWYGVPGSEATQFEKAMKKAAPELFDAQPDLLHHLVTIMNPNVLMKEGVPVFRTDQYPGEFVITFPRSYHAGFNHGYNFAEAVNFAPPDWIKMGRECVEHYANTRRYCVFSHDELVFKIAARHRIVDLRICAAAFQDLRIQAEEERANRKKVLEWGIVSSEKRLYELVPDDERQCEFCKTTIFTSGVMCMCKGNRMVCIKHYDKLCTNCKPSNHILKYRHKFDEIIPIYKALMEKVKPYEDWVKAVRTCLRGSGGPGGISVSELRNFIQQAENNKYPNADVLQNLVEAIEEAEETEMLINDLHSSVDEHRRLVVYGKEIALDNYEAWVYFIYYFEHIIDYRYYVTSPISVFRICTCGR